MFLSWCFCSWRNISNHKLHVKVYQGTVVQVEVGLVVLIVGVEMSACVSYSSNFITVALVFKVHIAVVMTRRHASNMATTLT